MLQVPFLFRVTAEDVRSDKPEQPHFDAAVRGATQHGISKSEILHVAQSKHHDIFPGNRFGLTTVWVNRRDGKMGTGATLAATANPALTVNSRFTQIDAKQGVATRFNTVVFLLSRRRPCILKPGPISRYSRKRRELSRHDAFRYRAVSTAAMGRGSVCSRGQGYRPSRQWRGVNWASAVRSWTSVTKPGPVSGWSSA
jgi:hypothetical protein